MIIDKLGRNMPKDGDHVRVVLEGKAYVWGPRYDSPFGLLGQVIDPKADHVVSVERIPPPPPPIPDDAIGVTGSCAALVRLNGAWVYATDRSPLGVGVHVQVIGRQANDESV